MKFGFAVLLLAASCFASDIPKSELSNMYTGTWRLPSQFTDARLVKLLNLFNAKVYGKGFRYIGEAGDFFHGHILVEGIGKGPDKILRPRAILYHTQEEAYKAHWEPTPALTKYDYLDVTTRNWIQWLSDDPAQDGVDIRNAREYVDAKKKDPSVFFGDHPAPVFKAHYTIHGSKLDDSKLGFNLDGESEFEFYADCNTSPENEYDHRHGPYDVVVPGQGTVCLKFSTALAGYFERF